MFSPILVPLDGSALAERALEPALTLARENHAELLLTRVAVATQILVPAEPGYGVLYPDQSLAEAHKEADQYLRALEAAYADEEPPTRVQVREGDVAGALVDAALEAHAGLIVMSSHGYSGVRRWVLGSVAERVLHAAPCPVWVVRGPTPPRHVLITLDGSPLAEKVLPPAMAVARAFGAEVSLLRVVPEITSKEIQALNDFERGLGLRFADETREAAGDYLALVADRFEAPDLKVHTAVRFGPAADAILDHAERHEIDLVAMTTHGHTGLRRWIYGSVMQKVLDQWPGSMLVSRAGTEELE